MHTPAATYTRLEFVSGCSRWAVCPGGGLAKGVLPDGMVGKYPTGMFDGIAAGGMMPAG